MKWMIASDLHGSAFYCKKMIEAFEREGADRLLLLGDLLYHGPRHTHIPAWTAFGDGNLYLNPGSLSIPKEGSAHSYMTLEDGLFQWKTLEGKAYHTWKAGNV